MTSRHLEALQKSTIVRSFGLLEQIAPSAGARWAETLWFSVPRTRGQRARQATPGHPFQVQVDGHTDSVGSDEDNMRLSQGRADSVRSYLVTQGVPSARIKAVGRGESMPIADNKSPEGRANNRRVEIIVQPIEKR